MRGFQVWEEGIPVTGTFSVTSQRRLDRERSGRGRMRHGRGRAAVCRGVTCALISEGLDRNLEKWLGTST